MSRVDELRAELADAGLDEFCRRRIYREQMPVKLMRDLGRASLIHGDWNIERIGATKAAGTTMTARRKQVLVLIAGGCTDKEIAAHMGLSVETIKRHVRVVLGLLGASNRAHAVHLAHQQRVIS